MIPHPAGVVREVKRSPRLSCEAGDFAWQICRWVVFCRFAALDVRADYSVEYFLVPGGSSPVVLLSLSARTRLPHERGPGVVLPPWIPAMPRLLWVRPACS